MSDSSSSGPDSTAPRVTVEGQGLSIEKAFAADEFDTPAIVLTITNGRASPVKFRLIDPLPEELDQSDIGFHPEYAAEGWTRREDGDLQLDRELGAGEEIKSVYGIRLSEVQDPASLLQEPTIDSVEEIEEADEEEPSTADASADQVEESIPEGDDAEEAEPDEEEEATDEEADESDDRETGTPDRSTAGSRARAGDTVDSLGTPTADAESVASALAAELERGSVDDDTLRTLNDHLSPKLAQSSQVRIDKVQSRLSDLEAYTEALEGILDTMGTDDDIVDTMGTVQEDLEEVAARTDALRRELDATMDDLDRRAAEIDGTADDLEDLRDDFDDGMDDVEGRLDDLDESLDDVGDRLEDLDGKVDTVESNLRTSIDDLEAEIEDVHENLQDLIEWRDNFVGAVGGGGGGGGGDE